MPSSPHGGIRNKAIALASGFCAWANASVPDILEAACQRALAINARSYRSVESILAHGLDAQPVTSPESPQTLPHANLRGPEYFH